MHHHASVDGTPTDPVWAAVVLAGLIVLGGATVVILAHAGIQELRRRWREAGEQIDQAVAELRTESGWRR